jgi:hypothetical protein
MGISVDKDTTDIQHLPLEVQAAHVALFRLRAALACTQTVTQYRAYDGPTLSEGEAVAFVSALPLPVALSGIKEGSVLRLEARKSEEDASTGPEGIPGWSEADRYGPDRDFRVVALRATERLILAQARSVQRSLQGYSLDCGHSMGMSYDDSDGPLADEARRLGAIACFTLGPSPRIISSWTLDTPSS